MTDPTQPDDTGPEERDDLLAAEYVLGTLAADERRAARERAVVDGAFAARIREWEQRLEPLNDAFSEVAVPDLMPRIEERLFGGAVATAPPRRWLWPAWGLGGLATAALVVLALTFWPPGPVAPVILQAELATEEAGLVFAARFDAGSGLLEISRATGGPAPAGQDYELWLIGADGVPQSLGLLREPVVQVAATLAEGVTLAVSLEPEGGSPEPVPTGPVLAAAPLTEV